MMNEEVVALSALPRELAAITDGAPPSYRKLWTMVVDGRLAAEQVNGRYQVRRADLTSIAVALGLRLKAPDPAPKPSRKVADRSTLVAA